MKMKPYDLHDYTIDDLSIDPCGGVISIHMVSPYSGPTHGPVVYEKELHLVLMGVRKVHISDIYPLNIVADILTFTEPDNSDCYRLCAQILNPKKDWHKSSHNKILYIEPSAGIELYCQYSELEIRPIREPTN